ncbi:AhpC/TSA family protein [Paludibaculum fermentans]|uniref:thioredoxin-dependent peroxiredoxin n=2 Tax=Paludibaculum fermentans TaxID=1473598 RepID=A0A7S7NY86_PALFE|nr:AhpC/TSA family protein [Paludibaculum fermentans]
MGQAAPDFSLVSLSGQTVRLSSATQNSDVVLVVLRGFPGYQCPVCNRQVQDYVHNSQGFADAGVRVLLVYPGPAGEVKERAREFASDKKLPAHFDLLLDPDYQFTQAYDLRWSAKGETAYPSTFLIDRKGRVYFSKTSKTHGGRTTAAEVLDLIRTQKR